MADDEGLQLEETVKETKAAPKAGIRSVQRLQELEQLANLPREVKAVEALVEGVTDNFQDDRLGSRHWVVVGTKEQLHGDRLDLLLGDTAAGLESALVVDREKRVLVLTFRSLRTGRSAASILKGAFGEEVWFRPRRSRISQEQLTGALRGGYVSEGRSVLLASRVVLLRADDRYFQKLEEELGGLFL